MLSPIGPFMLVIIFIIQYNLDKNALFTQSSCIDQINFRITKKIWHVFEYILVINALGNLVIDSLNSELISTQKQNKLFFLNLLNLIACFFYVIMSYFFHDFLFTAEKTINDKYYSKYKN